LTQANPLHHKVSQKRNRNNLLNFPQCANSFLWTRVSHTRPRLSDIHPAIEAHRTRSKTTEKQGVIKKQRRALSILTEEPIGNYLATFCHRAPVTIRWKENQNGDRSADRCDMMEIPHVRNPGSFSGDREKHHLHWFDVLSL
jgi:hypothetical protein